MGGERDDLGYMFKRTYYLINKHNLKRYMYSYYKHLKDFINYIKEKNPNKNYEGLRFFYHVHPVREIHYIYIIFNNYSFK